jgi:UDP-glucose 4-epimerase
MPPKVVLVTGVSGYLGGNLAGRLAGEPGVERVIAVDAAPPSPRLRARLDAVEVLRVDIRNPLVAKVIADARVDTVVHASLTAHPADASGAVMHKETNVVGTMQLLAACQKAPSVRKLVVKSTAAVYGAGPRDVAVFTEDMADRTLPASGYARDSAEVEGYVRGFARRRPDVCVTTLRLTNLIGPSVDTVLTRYFALPFVPTVLGFDGRLQLLHPDDAVAALALAVREDIDGAYNVGGDGVLLLSQAIRRAGRVPVPMPGAVLAPMSRLFRGTRLVDLGPEQLRYLDFGRVLDTGKLAGRTGFAPRWSTAAAFDDYVTGRGLRPVLDPEMFTALQRRVPGVPRVTERAGEE